MTRIERSALVPYSSREMYRLVADIESYPEFLPWCRSIQMHENTGSFVRATLELKKGPVHKSFTTVNDLQEGRSIEMRLEKGPFRNLHGLWEFHPLGEHGCKVSLVMEFEFQSRIMSMTIGPVFNDVTNRLVDAFTERAVQVYGRR